jgi:glutathione dehydrogenase/transferase
MTIYCKAGPDKISLGDCPFAHYVRLVLEEKNLPYDLQPSVQETKPTWLIDYYDGKMPALRHRKECYVESDVIVNYLEFFFPTPSLTCDDPIKVQQAEEAINGIFPIIAKYIKHTPDDDENDQLLLDNLHLALETLNQHFIQNVIPNVQQPSDDATPYYLTGPNITLLDCSLAPKLYHMKVACETLKNNKLHIPSTIRAYMDHIFERPSFQNTLYPKETVIWGWTNARS